ncbi:MAG: HEAT repeat domain-containing protein [Candidatus Glassbacteria bacterium]|nr:HEAT repeat domain-containing protein [Candidatus Glassbacteria bacterium]
MLKIKIIGALILLTGLLLAMPGCEIKPPAQGEKLSEVEQLYDQENYKDAMNVARYNLKDDPKDPASVITVWKIQMLQGSDTKLYAQQLFKAVRERLPEFGSDLIPYLGRGLTKDENNPVRLFCLLCLTELPETASSEQIAKVLEPGYTLGAKTSDVILDDLQVEAALMLGMRRYTPAYEGIVALTGSGNAATRGEAVMALGYLGDQRALPVLEELTKNSEVAAKADSAIALIKGQ